MLNESSMRINVCSSADEDIINVKAMCAKIFCCCSDRRDILRSSWATSFQWERFCGHPISTFSAFSACSSMVDTSALWSLLNFPPNWAPRSDIALWARFEHHQWWKVWSTKRTHMYTFNFWSILCSQVIVWRRVLRFLRCSKTIILW